MTQKLVLSLAAGLVSALLFASVASGSMLAMVIFTLAPLPLMLAMLGLSQISGVIAATFACLSLALMGGVAFAGVYGLSVACPALALCFLSQRPPVNSRVGDILLWSALISALVTLALTPVLDLNSEEFRTSLLEAIHQMSPTLPTPENSDMLVRMFARAIPPMLACVTMSTLLCNLYLAGRILKASDQLPLPWPDIPALTLPASTALILIALLAGLVVSQGSGTIATVGLTVLLLAYACLGLAVFHHLSRHWTPRGLILSGLYLSLFILGWPLLLLAIVGLADSLIGLRRRLPLPPSTHI